MSGVTLRRMDVDDVERVCAIDRECFPIPWSRVAFEGELRSTVGYYRVAELAGRIVGYVGSHIILDEAHITTFGVDPAARRRGVGERLLVDVLREALRQKCHRVTLEVRESNEAAQALYRKLGFTPVSRRRGYYTDNGEDAIVMWIDDTTRIGFQALLEERARALAA